MAIIIILNENKFELLSKHSLPYCHHDASSSFVAFPVFQVPSSTHESTGHAFVLEQKHAQS